MPKKMIEITSSKDIPKFKSEAEESAFWDTHTYSPAMLENFKPGARTGGAAMLRKKRQQQAVELQPDIERAVIRAAKEAGRTPSEFVNEALKKLLRVS